MAAEIVEELELAWKVANEVVVQGACDVHVTSAVFDRRRWYAGNDALGCGRAVVAGRDVNVKILEPWVGSWVGLLRSVTEDPLVPVFVVSEVVLVVLVPHLCGKADGLFFVVVCVERVVGWRGSDGHVEGPAVSLLSAVVVAFAGWLVRFEELHTVDLEEHGVLSRFVVLEYRVEKLFECSFCDAGE